MAANKIDARQSRLVPAQAMIGSASGDTLDTIFPKINDELAKLFEDRNIFLTDGGIITWTGTQIQFGENLNLVLNQKISGAAPQVISLGSSNVTLANNEMWYAVINRTAGTAVMAIASTLPAVTSANQEVFLIAKRIDAGDGTQRLYWRNGMALNAGQTVRLGASGSGSGGSRLEDLDSLLFRASYEDVFDEGPTSSLSGVDSTSGKTDTATYNAAKGMYTLNYDAGKTIAAGTTTTNINISATAAFTVKIGDVVVNASQARRITAVASQSSFTTEAFSVAPTLASQVTVSQAVYSKDVYNLTVDGNAISAAFPASTFQEILTDYEDTTAANDNIFDVSVAPVIGYSASHDGTTFTNEQIRPTLETDTLNSVLLPAAGSALYFRFFAHKTSGSGIVNLLRYKTFMQKATSSGAVAGGVTNTAYAFTNSVGTPINCAVSLVGGKTTITLTWQYAVGVYSGTTASSIEVWLNGQKLPRFVNSTLTPDGSFLETSSTVITLDRDYSFQNLSVEVFQRTFVVDNSTINTTNIANLQTVPTVQKFLSGSGTYTTPTTPRVPRYIKVRMVGGGGGGGGGGSGGGNGGNGGNTTFGTSLLVANGGGQGAGSGAGGAGGTASLGTGPIGTALSGATGAAGGLTLVTGGIGLPGQTGGATPFGGAGPGSYDTGNGGDAKANTGSGGGSGGTQPNAATNNRPGGAGGAGGYIDAIIASPLTTYAYVIGTAGTGGTAGTNGYAGGAGGTGYIIVEEYY